MVNIERVDLSDSLLFARARAGDRAAQHALIEAHRPEVLATCRNHLRDLPDAVEDVCQETFVTFLASLDRIHEPEKLPRWLGKVAISHSRKHRRQVDRRLPMPERPGVVADPAIEVADRMAVGTVLAGVGSAQSALLVSHYVHDRPLGLIEEERGLASGSGKVLLHRARRAARSIAEALDVRALVPAWLIRWTRGVEQRAHQFDPIWLGALASNAVAATAMVISGILAPPPVDADVTIRGAPSVSGSRAAHAVAMRANMERLALNEAPTPGGPTSLSSSTKDDVWLELEDVDVPGTSGGVGPQPREPRRYTFGIRTGVPGEGADGALAVTVNGESEARERFFDGSCDVVEESPALAYCEG